MNILYLNHYAGSPALGMEYRPYYLAREWVGMGHRVQIVAGAYSHVRTLQPQPCDELIDGIAYRWLRLPAYSGNGIGRAWNIWHFLRQVWQQAPRLAAEFKPDVVIASSTYPMDIWVARRIARLSPARSGTNGGQARPDTNGSQVRPGRRGMPTRPGPRDVGALMVFEVHDLWPLSLIELSGMSRWHPFAVLCRAAEAAAYRHADRVVSMLPKVHAYMAERGLDLERLHIVPNGIAPGEWQGDCAPLRADVAAAIAAQRAAGRSIVGYAGSMGLPNALDVLLDATKLMPGSPAGPVHGSPAGPAHGSPTGLVRDPPIAVVMVGDGLERERLARRIADERLSHVLLLPPIAKAQIPDFLAQIDVAYIGWQKVPIYRFGIAPNKLMDYMMAGCAVLHSVDAGNDPVAESGCGLTVAPESPTAVAAGLRQLLATPAEERRAMGQRGRAFVLAQHTYPVLAQRFLQAMQR